MSAFVKDVMTTNVISVERDTPSPPGLSVTRERPLFGTVHWGGSAGWPGS
jgi:hypothetical protein